MDEQRGQQAPVEYDHGIIESIFQWIDRKFQALVGTDHARQHVITATADHTSTATENQILKANANGLPVDASNTNAEVGSAVSLKHARQHAIADTNDHSDGADIIQRDGSVDFTGDQSMGGNKATNAANATNPLDLVNLDTLLDHIGVTLNYWFGSGDTLDHELTDSAAFATELVTGNDQTLTTLFFKSPSVDTPTPLNIAAGALISIHFVAKVSGTASERDIIIVAKLFKVDSNGSSNKIQIGDDTNASVELTTSEQVIELHAHVGSAVSLSAGQRFWVEFVAVNTSPPSGNVTVSIEYDDAVNHIVVPVSGDVLENFLHKAGGNMTGNITLDADKTVDDVDVGQANTERNADRNLFLSLGGTVTFTSSYELTLTGTTYIQGRLGGGGSFNIINAATTAAISDNAMIYVTLDRTANGTITMSVGNITTAITDDRFVLGWRRDDRFILCNGISIPKGGSVTANAAHATNASMDLGTGDLTAANIVTAGDVDGVDVGQRNIEHNVDRNTFNAGLPNGTFECTSDRKMKTDVSLFILGPLGGGADYNQVAAFTSAAIANGECIYVTLNRVTNASTLTPLRISYSAVPIGDDILILALMDIDVLRLWNGMHIPLGGKVKANSWYVYDHDMDLGTGLISAANLDASYKYIPVTPVEVLSDTTPTHQTWTPIDLSGIVPAGGVAVQVGITLRDNGQDNWVALDKNGRENFNSLKVYVQSEITYANANNGLVECDSGRIIEYYVADGADAVGTFIVNIQGYYIPVEQAD